MAFRTNILGRVVHKRDEFVNSKGYLLSYAPDHPRAMYHGYVYKHRLVVEKSIGRLLGKDEEIHHKDDDRLNNHPDNLEIVSEKDHQRLHAGWKKINGEWFKTCRPCGQFLKITENFYRMPTSCKMHKRFKVTEFSSICKKCYARRSKKYRKSGR